ncbi:MAG: TfuA-like protein [Pseudomonadota bacterium]
MSTWLFAGPSIWPDARTLPPATKLAPPIAAGDVYRAVAAGASRIAIVDGLFGDQPSVRHKEIMWALERGIPVVGSSSMGALRAAELLPFGMIGIGRVFAAFAAGDLERDGDVAVLHAPAYMRWQPLTIAVVDVIARLERAARRLAIGPHELEPWIVAARAIPFRERTTERIGEALRGCTGLHAGAAELAALALDDTYSQKYHDALALIDALHSPTAAPLATNRPPTVFEEAARRDATPDSDG